MYNIFEDIQGLEEKEDNTHTQHTNRENFIQLEVGFHYIKHRRYKLYSYLLKIKKRNNISNTSRNTEEIFTFENASENN